MTISAPPTPMQAMSVHLDGGLFAKAFKAVSATLGSSKTNEDTYNCLWVDMWADIGISLWTFDETSLSNAFISTTGRDSRPEFGADFSTVIRLTPRARFLINDAGRSSDDVLVMSPHDPAQQSLPVAGAFNPPGLRLASDSPLDSFSSVMRGIETVATSADLAAFSSAVTAAPADSFAASKDLLSIMVKISDAVGPCSAWFGDKGGSQVASVSPVDAHDLGFDFSALVSLPEAGQ